MTLADAEYMGGDAVTFWRRQLGGVLHDDLSEWLQQAAHEVQLLWSDVVALNRSRGMWREVTGWVAHRDPTNAWARNYDHLYIDGQIMRLARTVVTGRKAEHVSLQRLLRAFAERPVLLGEIDTDHIVLHGIVNPADPAGDEKFLKDLVRKIMPWRDKRIAHTQLEARVPDLAWDEIDQVIDGVSSVFRHYSARLTGVNYFDLKKMM
jgi:hypothetical protein